MQTIRRIAALAVLTLSGAAACAPAEAAAAGPGAALSPADAARIRTELRRALADRRLEFGRSTSNGSDAFVTTNVELVLCASGLFGRRTTVSFSSSVGGSQSERAALGRWDVEVSGQGLFVVLDVQRSNDDDAGRVARLRLDIDGRGDGFLDGAPVRSFDPATEDCR